MPTPYDNIYSKFTQKFTDYALEDMMVEDVEDIFLGYLNSSLSKFTQCKQDLSQRDEDLKEFSITLTDLEEEILATMMLLEWIQPKINQTNLMSISLNTRDFQQYSQANHLKEMIAAKTNIQRDIDDLIVSYGYLGTMEDLR